MTDDDSCYGEQIKESSSECIMNTLVKRSVSTTNDRTLNGKRDEQPRIQRAQLSSQKQRHDNTWYCYKRGAMAFFARLFFAITIIFVIVRLSEYTYLRRLATDVDDRNLFGKFVLSNEASLEEGGKKEKNGSKPEQLHDMDSKNENMFRITRGEASSSSIPENFFTILSDPRSGAEYTMSILDQYEPICSSGTFPKSAMLPITMPWLANDSIEKGCTLAYLRESVLDITSKPGFEFRCAEDYDTSKDDFANHIKRFCSVIKALDGEYNNEAITRLFVNTFAENQTSTFTGCKCPETTQVRILKVSTEWIGETLPVEASHIKGSKIIRLTRRNLFERYMSFIVAGTTGQWTIQNEMEKASQLNAFRKKSFVIDIDDMLLQITAMQESDKKAEQWVHEHGSQILWVDHSQIRDDLLRSFEKIFEFLGVSSRERDSVAGYMRHIEKITAAAGSLSIYNGAALLDYITNRDQVIEALWANGYGPFVGLIDEYKPLQYLVFPDHGKYRAYNSRKGLKITILNEGKHTNSTAEPSARFLAAIPLLKKMPSDSIVVLSNGGAVSLNPHIRSLAMFFDQVSKIRSLLQASNSVLISASDKCCSDAMINARPGAFFLPNGHRDARTCKIGECKTSNLLLGNKDTRAWSEFMRELSVRRNLNGSENIYLDDSYIAGTAESLLNFIVELNILAWEESRAVLTDYMYRFPDKIDLDYEQNLFAESFDGVQSKMNLDCRSKDVADEMLTNTAPARTASSLFVYSSHRVQSCKRKDNIEEFPNWDMNGIQIQPILEHIDRVLLQDISMGGIDRHFDKEIFYIVDSKGLWASKVLRDKYRVQPTEKFLALAQQTLIEVDPTTQRWNNLQRVVQSTGFPYWAWYGDWKDCNYLNVGNSSIPLFTTCAMTACNHSFPMPSYMTIIDSQPDTQGWYRMFRQFDQKYPWDAKIRKVVWRGALSENNPLKVFDSQRWRLCQLVTSLMDPRQKDMFDIGLTNIPEFLTDQVEIDASIVGGIVEGISSMNDFQKYYAVLDMDGNSWSSRFGTMLCYNSVAMKVMPIYADYFFYDLIPWKHYIPIKNDLSDLLENVAFVLDPVNESVMKEIVASANLWCAERFTHPGLIQDMLDIWERYVQLLDRGDKNWSSAWELRKNALLSSSSNLPLVQLT